MKLPTSLRSNTTAAALASLSLFAAGAATAGFQLQVPLANTGGSAAPPSAALPGYWVFVAHAQYDTAQGYGANWGATYINNLGYMDACPAGGLDVGAAPDLPGPVASDPFTRGAKTQSGMYAYLGQNPTFTADATYCIPADVTDVYAAFPAGGAQMLGGDYGSDERPKYFWETSFDNRLAVIGDVNNGSVQANTWQPLVVRLVARGQTWSVFAGTWKVTALCRLPGPVSCGQGSMGGAKVAVAPNNGVSGLTGYEVGWAFRNFVNEQWIGTWMDVQGGVYMNGENKGKALGFLPVAYDPGWNPNLADFPGVTQ